jgi:hypothetical protein
MSSLLFQMDCSVFSFSIQNKLRLYETITIANFSVHYTMYISLSYVLIAIAICTWSEYIGHSAVAKNTDEISTLGSSRHEAKAAFSSDGKSSIVRWKAGCMKESNRICDIGFLSIFIGEEVEKGSCFLDAVLRRGLHILPQVPTTSGLDSVGIVKQISIFWKTRILLGELVPINKEEAVVLQNIVVAVSPWRQIVTRSSDRIHYTACAS